MTMPEMFNVVPWKVAREGEWIHCYADSDINPDWAAALAAPVTDIGLLEHGDDLHAFVQVELTPTEILMLDFGAIMPIPYEAHHHRLRLWVNDLGGIEVTGIASYLERLQERLRAVLGFAGH